MDDETAEMSLCLATDRSHCTAIPLRHYAAVQHVQHKSVYREQDSDVNDSPRQGRDLPDFDERPDVRLLIEKYERSSKPSSLRLSPSSTRMGSTLNIKKDRTCTGSTATTAASRFRQRDDVDDCFASEEDDVPSHFLYNDGLRCDEPWKRAPRDVTYQRDGTAKESLSRARPQIQEEVDPQGICLPMASFARPATGAAVVATDDSKPGSQIFRLKSRTCFGEQSR